MTKALATLETQLADVDNLIARHPNRQKGQQDLPEDVSSAPEPPNIRRPPGNQRPLLRACVVLTYAAWEMYFEDSLLEAVTAVARALPVAKLEQTSLANYAGKQVKDDPWVLADDRWRQAVIDAATVAMRGDGQRKYGVSMAKPGDVLRWHDEILGEPLLNYCTWGQAYKDNQRVKDDLAVLVEARNAIAHTGTTETPLNLRGVEAHRNFTWELGQALDTQITSWMDRQVR